MSCLSAKAMEQPFSWSWANGHQLQTVYAVAKDLCLGAEIVVHHDYLFKSCLSNFRTFNVNVQIRSYVSESSPDKSRCTTNDLFRMTIGTIINQYNAGPMLIVILQAIGEKKILNLVLAAGSSNVFAWGSQPVTGMSSVTTLQTL